MISRRVGIALAEAVKHGVAFHLEWMKPREGIPGSVTNGGHYRVTAESDEVRCDECQKPCFTICEIEHEDLDYAYSKALEEVESYRRILPSQ